MRFCPDSPELLRTFVAETEELLDALTFDVGRHARPPSDLARRARRAVHIIKGNAAMLGLDELVTVSHEAERQLEGRSTGECVLAALDAIGPQIDRLREQIGSGTRQTRGASTRAEHQMVRVDHQRLIELEKRVREVSAGVRFVQNAASEAQNQPLNAAINALTDRVSALDRAVTATRMQPFASLFGRASRLIRELSISTGRPASFGSTGEHTEVDRAVLETLHPAVVQLIRNSFAHGFEPKAERERAGKPATGRIHIDIALDQSSITLRYSDDGRGLDRERLGRTARGMMPPEKLAQLDGSELDRLIFEPGFSTSVEAGPLAGRGVGMDVVRTQTEQLGGRIEIENTPGAGLSIRLIVPIAGRSTSG